MADKKLQVLRNSNVNLNRAAALAALEGKLNSLSDGELCLARYTDNGKVVSVLGIAYSNEDNRSVTYLDTAQFSSDIQSAINSLIDGADNDYNTLKKLEDFIKTINGNDATDGSFAKAIKDAVDNLDSEKNAAAGKFVTGVKITDGKLESVAEGGLSSTNKTITITDGFKIDANIDGTTIVKDGNGVLSVASSALTQYVGSNAIKVSNVDANNQKTIFLKLHDNEKILSQSDNGLISSLSLNYDSTNKKIQLIGINNEVVSEFNSSAFVVDGMLDSVAFSTETGKENILVFTFNTDAGKNAIEVDLSKYIDVYTAGNGINISDHSIAVKLDSGNENAFLTVGANGLKLSGVQTAINNAIEALDMSAAVEAEDGEFINKIDEANGIVSATKGAFATTVEASYAEGAGKVAPTAKAVRDAINGAASTAQAALSAEVARAKGAEDTIESSVGLNENGSHITTGGHYTGSATTIAGEIAALDSKLYDASLSQVGSEGNYIKLVSQSDGKVSATADAFVTSIANSYDANGGKVAPTAKAVREAISAKNVSANGDDYVSASAANNEVSVAATNSTITSLGYADSALQSVSASGGTYIAASFGNRSGSNGSWTQALAITPTYGTFGTSTTTENGITVTSLTGTNGIAKVEDIVSMMNDLIFDCGTY